MNAAPLHAGFTDSVRESQAVFRAVCKLRVLLQELIIDT